MVIYKCILKYFLKQKHMLFTIRQISKGLELNILSNFANWWVENSSHADKINASKDVEKLLLENKQIFIDFLEELDGNKDGEIDLAKWDEPKNRKALEKIINIIGSDGIDIKNKNLKVYVESIENFVAERTEAINKTSEEKTDLLNNEKLLDYKDFRKLINSKSFEEFTGKLTLAELSNLYRQAETIKRESYNENKDIYANGADLKLKAIYTEAWYTPKWKFDLDELSTLNLFLDGLISKRRREEAEKKWIINSKTEIKEEVQVEEKVKVKEEQNVSTETQKTIEEKWLYFNTLRKNINGESFDQLVYGLNFSKLEDLFNKAFREKTEAKELKKIYKELGYKQDWLFFDNDELSSINILINAIYTTQERVRETKNYKEKIALIMDHDQDWVLDNEVKFLTRELEFTNAIETKEEYDNLLKNLWYSWEKEFDNALNENYLSTRDDFKSRLETLLSVNTVLNPGEMLASPNAVKDFLQYKESIRKWVQESINENDKTKNLPQETKSLLESAIKEWIYGVNLNSTRLLAKEVSDEMIKQIQVDLTQEKSGLYLPANFTIDAEGNIKAEWNYILIPFISAEWAVDLKEIQKYYEKQGIKEWVKVNGKVKIEILGYEIETTQWIKIVEDVERKKKELTKVLDSLFTDISEWKPYSSKYAKGLEWGERDYNRVAQIYKVLWANELAIKELKEWIINNFERSTYEEISKSGSSKITEERVGSVNIAGLMSSDLYPYGTDIKLIEKVEAIKYEPKKTVKMTTAPEKKAEEIKENNDEVPESIKKLIIELEKFEQYFNSNTRANKYADEFMNPEFSLEKRWNGLLKLSTQPKLLRDAKLKEFLEKINTEAEKEVVVSTLVQYIRKANDFDNWNIESWNNKVEKFINKDRVRRKWFNTLFWFNTDKYAEEYYKKLLEWKGNIWSTSKIWTAFDAVSSLGVWTAKKVQKWVDVLYTNQSVLTVSDKVISIEITDNADVDSFIKKVEWMNNIQAEIKKEILDWLKKWEISLKFYKDPYWFDDRIILINSTWNVVAETTGQWEDIGLGVKDIKVFHPNVIIEQEWILFQRGDWGGGRGGHWGPGGGWSSNSNNWGSGDKGNGWGGDL